MRNIPLKAWILILAGLGVVALLVLASGLSSLDLNNQTNYALPTEQIDNSSAPNQAPDLSDFFRKLWVAFFIMVPLSILYLILSPEARKRFLITLIPVLVMLLGLWYLNREFLNNYAEINSTPRASQAEGALGFLKRDYTVLQPFSPKSSPNWLIYILSLGVTLLGVLALFWGWRMNKMRRQKQPLEQLALSAQDALEDIRAGGDLKEIILRCYQEMNQVASEKRAVVRPGYLTPREFTQKLEAAGLPGEQVRRLTRLFEAVRYGAWQPGPRDEKEAIVCLETVVEMLRTSP